MIRVEPLGFVVVHQLPIDQPEIDRRKRQGFEAQHLAFGAGDRSRFDDDKVFDSDPEGAGMRSSPARSTESSPEPAPSSRFSRCGAALRATER